MEDILGKKGVRYKHNAFTKSTFHCKSTMLYGKSGTGKSYLLNELLAKLKDEFLMMLCFSATADVDKMFPMYAYTPHPCIFEGLDIGKFEEIMETATKRMAKYRASRELVNLVKSAKVLKEVYSSRGDKRALNSYNAIMKAINRYQKEVIDVCDNKDDITNATDNIVGMYRILMLSGKTYIKKNSVDLEKYAEEQLLCIKYVKLNPYILIVLNDLGDEIGALAKKDRTVFEAFFNKGRHMGITTVILLQNPYQISKQARQAVNNHIFTTTDVFQQYIESIPGGNILKRKAGDAIESIVGQDEKRAPRDRIYSKILLNGDTIEYVTADKLGTQYPVGKPSFRKIMEAIEIKPESRI